APKHRVTVYQPEPRRRRVAPRREKCPIRGTAGHVRVTAKWSRERPIGGAKEVEFTRECGTRHLTQLPEKPVFQVCVRVSCETRQRPRPGAQFLSQRTAGPV